MADGDEHLLPGTAPLTELTEQLHRRREKARARRRRGEDRQAARARQADRARADRPAGRRGHLRRARHPRPAALLPARDGRASRRPPTASSPAGATSTAAPAAIAAYDFTVMAGSMGMTGELKVGRLREMALQQADAVHLAARLGRRPHPGGDRLALRRLRPPLPRGGRDVGRDPDGRGDDGPLRRRHRLHPGALGLRPDGLRPGRDGARRAAPDQGRDRRGHLDGGPRRRQGPLPQVRSRRPRGRRRRRVHRGDQDLPLLLPVQLRGEAAGPRDRRPRRPHARRS